MLTYKEFFETKRPDGRHVNTMAAQMAMFRDLKKELALPENLTKEVFELWRQNIADKNRELLSLPEFTSQPDPLKLSQVQRDGYRVEKWEFYPDDYTAVPYLALIPDGADKSNPVPGVMCFLGSNHCKEMAAGEPLPEHPNFLKTEFYERNQMAKHIVKSGMAAFVFDNPGIGETAFFTNPDLGQTQGYTREQFCHGYLDMGMNYVGLSVFQKLCFMKHLRTFEYIDKNKLGISSHSLGTETAISLGLLCDDIKAIVFNDYLHDDLKRYVSVTEQEEFKMFQDIGNWHIVPGKLRYYGFPELCAAFAPRFLALTEGGSDECINIVKKAYEICDAQDNLLVSYYPEFQNPQSRKVHENIPKFGLSKHDYLYHYSYCVAEDHSFRKEPALQLLKKCFELED